MSILVATDLSDHSRDALRWASACAADRGEELHIVHVIDSLGDDDLWTALFETPDEIERRVLTAATEKASEFATKTLDGYPTPDQRKILVSVGPPAEEIERFAKQKNATLLVSGTSGHGRLRNAVFGSTAHQLTQHTSRPTVYVPKGAPTPPASTILVALDFSECSKAALAWAAGMAKAWGSIVVAVHGIGVSALSPDYEPTANFVPMVDALTEQRREQIQKMLAAHGLDEAQIVISRASPTEAILETASDRSVDLIAMGTHGRGAVKRLFLGSVALRVLRAAPCAIATIHESV